MPRRNYPKRSKKTLHLVSRTPYLASTPDIACHKKRRFSSKKQAEEAARTQELTDFNLELEVYHCPWCQGWHLTRK